MRARSYLDANCAHCHAPERQCSYRAIRFEYNADGAAANLGICMEPEEPVEPSMTYNIAPGNVARSMVHYRMNTNDEAVRMPLIGRSMIHTEVSYHLTIHPVPEPNLQLKRPMNKLSSLLIAGLMGTLPALAQDNCATAIPITAGTYVIDTIDGPEVPLPVCATGGNTATRGEWYVYTAPANVSVTVTSDLPENVAVTPGLDTRVHVYTGSCGALTCYDGDDDAGSGYLSIALFNLQAGQSVYIAWDNRWNARGFSFS